MGHLMITLLGCSNEFLVLQSELKFYLGFESPVSFYLCVCVCDPLKSTLKEISTSWKMSEGYDLLITMSVYGTVKNSILKHNRQTTHMYIS